jgi:hypothetical protein
MKQVAAPLLVAAASCLPGCFAMYFLVSPKEQRCFMVDHPANTDVVIAYESPDFAANGSLDIIVSQNKMRRKGVADSVGVMLGKQMKAMEASGPQGKIGYRIPTDGEYR